MFFHMKTIQHKASLFCRTKHIVVLAVTFERNEAQSLKRLSAGVLATEFHDAPAELHGRKIEIYNTIDLNLLLKASDGLEAIHVPFSKPEQAQEFIEVITPRLQRVQAMCETKVVDPEPKTIPPSS